MLHAGFIHAMNPLSVPADHYHLILIHLGRAVKSDEQESSSVLNSIQYTLFQ